MSILKNKVVADNIIQDSTIQNIAIQNSVANDSATRNGEIMDVSCLLRQKSNLRQDRKKWRLGNSIIQLLIATVTMIAIAAYAPAHGADDQESRSNETPVSEQNQASKSSQPDNLSEYAIQQVKAIKDENIGISDMTEEMFDPTERHAVQQAGTLQGDVGLSGEYSAYYYLLDKLNTGLPPLATPPNLATPLATSEFFQSAVLNQQYDLVAYVRNMNLIYEQDQRTRSIELSKQLDLFLSGQDL